MVDSRQQGNKLLTLNGTSLTPVDSLAIGYFLSSVSVTTSNADEFIVDLNNCSLGDAGTKSLMQSICRSVDTHSTHLRLDLGSNEIHEEGASHIAELLNSTGIVTELWLHNNPIGDKGLQTIFDALKQNKTLRCLTVTHCGMTDTGVASLADALYTNIALEILFISGNEAITENGLTCSVEAVSRHSGLKTLFIPNHLGADKVRKTINEARRRNGMPDIGVHGWW